jgi:hypothetical protein
MDRKQEMDALHAAAAAAYEVLREHGMEHFVSVLVVDSIASTQVCTSTTDVRKGLTALVNGEIVLEDLVTATAGQN